MRSVVGTEEPTLQIGPAGSRIQDGDDHAGALPRPVLRDQHLFSDPYMVPPGDTAGGVSRSFI